MKTIDTYIMRKYLVTFFVSLTLIIAIAVVFDISEKVDDFLGKGGKAPSLYEIAFVYYANFIPYFASLFAPLFAFISVIYFTSRMAFRSEIIAILAAGVSYRRMLAPFLAAAFIVSIMLAVLGNFIVPVSNLKKNGFEREYFGHGKYNPRNMHRQIAPGTLLYIEYWSNETFTGQKLSIEQFDGRRLVSKLMSQSVSYDTLHKRWTLVDYIVRTSGTKGDKIYAAIQTDTLLPFTPAIFQVENRDVETMNYFELNEFVEKERESGSNYMDFYLIEKYKRWSTPFSTIILTLIAVPLAGRRVRGGVGLHIGMGVGLGFSYIFFDKVAVTYAINGTLAPVLAAWLPNVIFLFVGAYLIRTAQR